MAILSSISWVSYGLLVSDWHIYIPNSIGLITGLMNLSTYIYLKLKKDKNSENDETDDLGKNSISLLDF